jgi:hypothetical protein
VKHNDNTKLTILDLAIQCGLADVMAGRVVAAEYPPAKLEVKFRKFESK